MPRTIKQALDHSAIEMPRQLVSEFKFSLKDIAAEVTIRLYKPVMAGKIMFDQSHFIQTPLEQFPYRTSRPWNDDEPSALHQVVDGITSRYDAAISQGHQPNENWLVRNDDFN